MSAPDLSTKAGQAAHYDDVKGRLWGTPSDADVRRPDATLFVRNNRRPGANLPRNGTTMFHRRERAAVDLQFALRLVCEDRGLTPDQMLNSAYCAAVAARHMLWAVLLDGGHSASSIARQFGVDHRTVQMGIKSFREFQRGML